MYNFINVLQFFKLDSISSNKTYSVYILRHIKPSLTFM